MDYYKFWDNTEFESLWTYAYHIEPASRVVAWCCATCGRRDRVPAGAFNVALEEGSQFPDMLMCGASPLLIVSERMLVVLRGAGITCFNSFQVGVTTIQESDLRPENAPRYFRIEVTGQCMIDFAASGATITDVCQRCARIAFTPSLIRQFRLIEGSWDGSDLFRDRRHFPAVTFCTRRVLDLAREHGLTNCSFEPMGEMPGRIKVAQLDGTDPEPVPISSPNVNDPRFARWVEETPPGNHQRWSAEFEAEWRAFIRRRPNATRDDVLEFMVTLRNDPRFQ